MEVIIVDTAEEVARVAADAITELFAARPEAVLGVATGSSPVGVYDELGRRVAAGALSLAARPGVHARRVRRPARPTIPRATAT